MRRRTDSFGCLPLGYVNEKPLNLEKATYSVLYVLLLIYAFIILQSLRKGLLIKINPKTMKIQMKSLKLPNI